MTASNHAIAGAVIALTVRQPILVVPLAFLSHFVLDTLPHYGYPGHKGFNEVLKHKLFYFVESWDVVAMLGLVFVLRGQGVLPYLAGLTAISPDFIWLYRYIFFERKGLTRPSSGWFTLFHQNIQRFERPWGVGVEVIWFALMFSVLAGLTR